MQEQNSIHSTLDSPDISPIKRHPALTWLIWYGAYQLFARFAYTIGMPLMTSFVASDSTKLSEYYDAFNLLITLGNIALATAIVVFVKDKLCRIVFGLMILANLYAIIVTLFTTRM